MSARDRLERRDSAEVACRSETSRVLPDIAADVEHMIDPMGGELAHEPLGLRRGDLAAPPAPSSKLFPYALHRRPYRAISESVFGVAVDGQNPAPLTAMQYSGREWTFGMPRPPNADACDESSLTGKILKLDGQLCTLTKIPL